MAKDKKIFILSDGSKTNSKGFRVLLSGVKMERFNANPVMLYGHDPEKLIGKWENITVTDNKMTATPVFDLKNEFAAEKARQIEEGFLRGASIGFIPLKWEYINDEYVMSESELVEASICAIPSDAGAVVLYNEKMERLNFEQVKLDFQTFNNKNQNEMEVLKLTTKTAESLALSGDYTPKDVELAVLEKDKEITALKLKLETQRKAGIETYLSAAVKAGKITEAEKQSFAKLAETDFESVKAIIDAKGEKASQSLSDMTAKSALAAGRETWDYLEWAKKDPAGLQKLKYENPAEFERLQATLK